MVVSDERSLVISSGRLLHAAGGTVGVYTRLSTTVQRTAICYTQSTGVSGGSKPVENLVSLHYTLTACSSGHIQFAAATTRRCTHLCYVRVKFSKVAVYSIQN